jgi:peroxiredoxin
MMPPMKCQLSRSRLVLVALFLLGILSVSLSARADSLNIPLKTGDEVPIERIRADGDTLILWTPSGFGMQPPASALAQELTFDDLETWLADLHTAFFVSRGHNSVDSFSPKALVELYDAALKLSGKKNLLLLTSGNGAKPVLKAARLWQQTHPGNPALRGMILFHPSLYAGRPALGQKADYLPVVEETNLPIFIIQPTLSTTQFRVNDLRVKLGTGGSQVFLRVIPGARDGFHVRPESDLSETDRKARDQLPTMLVQATRLLLGIKPPGHAAPARGKAHKVVDHTPGLEPYAIPTTPPLVLTDIHGKVQRLQDYRGRVVLVSFWASWCPPCVREMPSLNRLQGIMKNKPFTVLGVNIGETVPKIKTFLQDKQVDFNILMDTDQKAYSAWNVYVVPSNFIVDRNGKVRLGSVGGIEWDSPDIIQTLDKLIAETTPS